MMLCHLKTAQYCYLWNTFRKPVRLTYLNDMSPLKVHLRSLLCVLDFELVTFSDFLQLKRKASSKNRSLILQLVREILFVYFKQC